MLLQRPGQAVRIAMQGVRQPVGMGLQAHLLALHPHPRLTDPVRIRQQRIDPTLAPAHRIEVVLRIGVQQLDRRVAVDAQLQAGHPATRTGQQMGTRSTAAQDEDLVHGRTAGAVPVPGVRRLLNSMGSPRIGNFQGHRANGSASAPAHTLATRLRQRRRAVTNYEPRWGLPVRLRR